MAVELVRRRFTVDEYYGMADAGLLTEDDRVELIEGEILLMSAIGSPHASIVTILTRHYGRTVGEQALVSVQNPVRLSDLSEPQPDLMLLRPRLDVYAKGHPGPADVLLLIEVSDSSLAYDRDFKGRLYARAGIPELWIVDIAGKAVEVHLGPSPEGYADVERFGPGEVVVPRAFPGSRLEVASLFA